MNSVIPKQYLKIKEETVLQHTLRRLGQIECLNGVIVAIADNDEFWDTLEFELPCPVYVVQGGQERCHSVLRGLREITHLTDKNDWVLVHDAARPCVRPETIQHLVDKVSETQMGGLLAVPVQDTVKRVDADLKVQGTIDRNQLWLAQTPQMFRVQELQNALEFCLENGLIVTDESSAVEHCGKQVQIVNGSLDNIKITNPQDLVLARLYLEEQKRERVCE